MITRNIAVVLSGRDAGLARTLGAAAGSIHAFDQTISAANKRSAALAAGLKFAFIAIAAAAAIGLGAAAKQAIDFEVAMRNVNTVAHESESGLRGMSNAVLELSTRVPQTAKILAEGLYDIASSGFYGADALQILEVSATAATAGLTETAVASKAIVAVLNAYGLGAEHAADVSDVLFQTVELGVLTFEDLATQLGDVIAAAATAGIEFDEVGSAIATMTLSGLSAAESTVSLNRLVRELIDPSDALATAFRNLGYESGLAAIEEEGLFGTMEALRLATGGQIESLLKLFPEIRAARGAFALMAASGSNYARVQAIITSEQERAGATQRAFNEQMKALGNQWDLFVNKLSKVGIELGTKLIPALRASLEWLEKTGAAIGRGIANAIDTARPGLEAMGRGVQALGDLFEVLWDNVNPVIRLLAGLTFAAQIVYWMALGNAIEMVAGFLADHPALVQAIALAYGSVLAGRLLATAAGFIQMQAGLMAVRAGLVALSAQAVLGTIISRLQLLGSAVAAVFTMGNVANLRNFTLAFSGLAGVLASPVFLGAALVGTFFAVQTAMDNARRQAKELRAELEQDIDMTSLGSIQLGLDRIRETSARLTENFEDYRNLGGFLAFVGQTLTPLENDFLDTAAAMEETRKAALDLEQAGLNLLSAQEQLQAMFGITADEATRMLEALEFDPTQELTAEKLGELADKARVLRAESTAATPATNGFMDALAEAADVTTTAADRVGALDDAIAALIGTMLGAFDAETKFGQAMLDLTASLEENGLAMDSHSEKGLANRDALSAAAQGAIEYATAIAEQSGSVAEGVNSLKGFAASMEDTLVAAGMSREAARDLLAQLGLFEGNYEALLALDGTEEASSALADIEGMLVAIDQARATGTVNLDSAQFEDDAVAIGEWLFQIESAAPEATVLMDGEPFKATAEQVTAWAMTWDDSSPEAQALLGIIDPQHKFETLSEAAANWEAAAPTAEAYVDTSPAYTSIAGAAEKLRTWETSSATATVLADSTAANATISGSQARLAAWNRSRGIATVAADNTPANVAINNSQTRLNAWNAARGEAEIAANDTASGRISAVANALQRLNGSTAVVNVIASVSPEAANAIARSRNDRYGGIEMATGGIVQAGVVDRPTILFGEGPTGGEAFVPRYGNPNRNKAVLNTAASWYGMELRPAGGGGFSRNVVINNMIDVTIRARGSIANTDELVKLTRKEIADAQDKHDRELTRALGAR